MATLQFEDVERAHLRIAGRINRTPFLESQVLNGFLGHRLVFKCENFQKVGAFKARGALNALLAMKDAGEFPERVVTFSSGNHAQAVAWACSILGIPATIFMPEKTSSVKRQAARSYGAEVIIAQSRSQAEVQAGEMQAKEMEGKGVFLLSPFDNDYIIAGQGTACMEALLDGPSPTAVFVPCGGGGLLSGTLIAAKHLAPQTKIFGAEPALGNDAVKSYRTGEVVKLSEAPASIADGACTLSVSERTLQYIRKTDDMFEVSEQQIVYWTQWLTHLLKIVVEPTAALGVAAAARWLQQQEFPQTVLIILSGGNLSQDTHQAVWKQDFLTELPNQK